MVTQLQIKKHHKCNGCRALQFSHGVCDLGYEIVKADDHLFKPTARCPKPDKLSDYLDLLSEVYEARQAQLSK